MKLESDQEMLFSGSQESRSAKVRKQEQYKKELQQQMQEQADIKKRYLVNYHYDANCRHIRIQCFR